MTPEVERRLLADVQYLKDRQAILDVIHQQSRGVDRHDAELVADAFHENSWDEHGAQVTRGKQYGHWANDTHAKGSQINMHHITTHTCDIDGEVAHTESYVIGLMLNHDGVTARLLAGRYVDRLEKRDGQWKLVVRRSTAEVCFSGDATLMTLAAFTDRRFPKGGRDRTDLSYARPLEIDRPTDGW
jgi:SnoaL-like domain